MRQINCTGAKINDLNEPFSWGGKDQQRLSESLQMSVASVDAGLAASILHLQMTLPCVNKTIVHE